MADYWKEHWNVDPTSNNMQAQVERTVNKKPVDDALFFRTAEFVGRMMGLGKNSRLLDLAGRKS
jgi:hypothetical protein